MIIFKSVCRWVPSRAREQRAWAILLLACAMALPGCVSRTLLIESAPSGAEAVVDGRSVGLTPVTLPFRYGGQREVILLAPGCKPAIVFHDTTRFWRDTPPFDLVTDLVGGGEQQTLFVKLEPDDALKEWDSDKDGLLLRLRTRASTLRERAEAAMLDAAPREAPPPRAPARNPRQSRLGAADPLLIR
ncbi:MAG: PEGA domain-containing protein [Planctomycetes bacterium]|nr:PEGA domain-containing protein [Planctomycetota bacterium]